MHPMTAANVSAAVEDLQRANLLRPNDPNIQRELQSAQVLLKRTLDKNGTLPAAPSSRSSSSNALVPPAPTNTVETTSSSSSSPGFRHPHGYSHSHSNSRHIVTEVGVDAEAEYDDAAQGDGSGSDLLGMVRTLTDFTNISDEHIEQMVMEGAARIADNCSLMLDNKRQGMISESNKLLTRVGLLKRDLLVFVRRARRHRRIVVFRKQVEWLSKMSTATIDEITKYWNIDITDHE